MEARISTWRRSGVYAGAVLALWLVGVAGGRAGDFLPESTGLRFGVAPAAAHVNFHQGEAYADWNLPWKWDLGKKLTLQTGLDFSAGWFGEGAVGSAVIGAGPLLTLRREQFPLHLEAGVNVTGLTRTQFPDKDFGEPLQFATHIGVFWDFQRHFRLGCSFQHMSNAHLSDRNPGINMIMFELGYIF